MTWCDAEMELLMSSVAQNARKRLHQSNERSRALPDPGAAAFF